MFIASLPPQSCIRGIPRNPEFINITGNEKVRLSAPVTNEYKRAPKRVNAITKTTDPDRVSISRGEIGER